MPIIRKIVVPIRLTRNKIWLIPETRERFDSDGRWLQPRREGAHSGPGPDLDRHQLPESVRS